MKKLITLLLAALVLSSAAFADTSRYAFDCNALSASTQEGGQATGSFTVENGKGTAGIGYPPLDRNYVIQVLYKIDLSAKGASSAVLQISDVRNSKTILASSTSVLHFDGMDELALNLNLPEEKNEITVHCSLKSTLTETPRRAQLLGDFDAQ